MKQSNIINLESLVREENFVDFVYTPLSQAIEEIKKRWEDKNLEKKINEYFNGDIPEPLISGFKAVLFRQLFTPNYEFRHFMNVIKKLGAKPMFLEYYDDKFTSNNPIKYALGKMRFHKGVSKNSSTRIESRNIIEFNESDGKKIKNVKTFWGQSLIDFHHELLELAFPESAQYLFDTSEWFHRGGKNAQEYYTRYITLFLRNGILFENFSLSGSELEFVKEIFLPAFIEVWRKTGLKPIVVALLPVDTQDEKFWISYPFEDQIFIERKTNFLTV